MAICLHKLVSRVTAINPILLQSNRNFVTPTLAARNHIESKNVRKTVSVSKPTLLCEEARSNAQNIRCFSKTAATWNDASTEGGANDEQLSEVYEILRKDVPLIFAKPMDYSKIDQNIVFENRIRGKTYNGIVEYVKQMSYLRLFGHFYYAYVKMDVIKMTKHTEDSSIKIRWRITGITGYQILFKMIQFRVWNLKQTIEQNQQIWMDGFSTLYVNSDGMVVRHVVDKVMPDEDKQTNPIVQKVVDNLNKQIPKLALFVELSSDIAPTIV